MATQTLDGVALVTGEFASHTSLETEVVACDVSKKEDVDAMVKVCVERFGRVDYGAHCAGIGRKTLNAVTEADGDEYTALFSVNVLGTVNVLGSLATQMATQPTRTTAAIENTPLGTRINALCPAWTTTPMMDRDIELEPRTPGMVEMYTLMKRLVFPEEVSSVVVFLCSDAASFISGTGMMIDGGASLGVKIG
ncbi:hypothetical protein B0J14DRAFT_705487 [Halenospora varia]|nr:hypothetical protein B0J14DRAFT_705487 [Halenospora varia]